MAMQALEKFQLSALAEMDGGRINVAFAQALARVVGDCEDRPGEKKSRTITLQVEVTPILDASGVCDDAKVQMVITDSVPKRKTRIYDMALQKGKHGKGPHLLFRPDSLDDADQMVDFGEDNHS